MNHYPIDENYRVKTPQLDVPPRLLLGPGPSNAHPRVLQALGMQQVGHLDPSFLQVMADIQQLLRYAWQTDNELILAVSGTGSAAMEASLANVIEPGDVVLVGVKGYFGERLVEMAARYGADVRRLEKPWGEVFSLEELRAGLEQHRPAVLAIVHAETSTGACQPLEEVGTLCREHDCLLLVDSVTSLGGVPLWLDAWRIDVAYSCSQKGLGSPPGASPLTLGPRALARRDRRQRPVGSWYLDTTLLGNYWGQPHAYHHTASINLYYALREALRLVAEEGLSERWARHRANAELFWDGLADLGLACHVPHERRLPTLTTVRVPDGVDAQAVVQTLRQEYNIEIAGGFGPLAGKVWRIGLMGFNSRRENVVLLLEALAQTMKRM